MAKTIMNFGCGIFCPDGYMNVDGSFTVLLAQMPVPAALYGPKKAYVKAIRAGHVKHGTARRLHMAAASLDGFYASHVLEHMSRADCVGLLERVRLWLKPTGLARIVLPDLRLLADQYASGRIDAYQFVSKMHTAIYGMGAWNLASSHAFHRWMYDLPSFTRVLASLGYTDIQVCRAAQSALEEFAELDRGIGREDQSFYIEAAPGG